MVLFIKILEDVINRIIRESKLKAFVSEKEIQGYMLGFFRTKEDEFGYELRRESSTMRRYVRRSDGVLEVRPGKGRTGRIDFLINHEDSKYGIEIEYPRGKGRTDRKSFVNHIKNDCIKLSKEEFQERIILLFIYRKPPINRDRILQVLRGYPMIKFAYFRLPRQDEIRKKGDMSIVDHFTEPKDWIEIGCALSR